MKRKGLLGFSLILVSMLLLIGTSPVMAAKPDGSDGTRDVIAMSNGFPSGEHYNLNIHGKKADYVGDSTPGGSSVFILEYGQSTIQYVTNRKASLAELYVLDPLAEAFDGDPAKVQLPYEAAGYYVFGRILGKPNNGNVEPASSIILYPNRVVGAWNDTDPADPDFPTYTDGSLLPLGLIVGPNLYTAEPEGYVRFDPSSTPGKGKSKATDITELFTYTGWVIDSVLDTSGPEGEPDGIIDTYDIPLGDYDVDATTDPSQDYNNDGVLNGADVEAWLTDMAALATPTAWYYAEEWILNIADLVITEQGLENDGTKLLQIRFYPVDTTEFIP
ncbi:MAG: hypothetical protein E4G93_04480 [Dehalococcoidia bacterium]|nr:MAG: hypothetical protein E4G93_04480 [Dehalococcoidia bacterium]